MRKQLLAAAVLSVVAASPAAQSNKEQVVVRATDYVVDFVERFSNVVADERYVQDTTAPHRHRELRSEFLLVKLPGLREWYQFRDVLEVDGRAVGNRQERLTKLFVETPRNALARAQEVVREGSRYNLEEIGTLNKPLGAIAFLQPAYVDRFRFVFGTIDKKLGPNVRAVQFIERTIPTILRRPQANGDLPARGIWWIDEATGRVVKSELRAGNAQITTSFTFDSELGINVPAEMEEEYGFRGSLMTSKATYGRFRRFGVTTEEKIEKAGVQ